MPVFAAAFVYPMCSNQSSLSAKCSCVIKTKTTTCLATFLCIHSSPIAKKVLQPGAQKSLGAYAKFNVI
jgi:hypothetical protein